MKHTDHTTAKSLDELAPWRDQWNALADAQELPMARYEWFGAAERHLAGNGSVRIVYCLDAPGNLIAAAALECRVYGGGNKDYQILGLSRLYEPSTLLYRDEPARHRLLQSMMQLDGPVILGRLWTGGPDVWSHVSSYRFDRHALWLSKYSAPSQYLDFTHTYAEYLAGLPSRRRYDLRRAYKRAEAAGPVTADFRQPCPSDLDTVLALALEIESRSWKGYTGCAVLANADLHGFIYDVLRSHAIDGRVLIAFLKAGRIPIATQICLVAHDRLWLLKIGYDQAYHRLSPGLILMNETIRYSYTTGLRGLEFLGSAENWVDAWRPSLRNYRLVAAYPYTVCNLLRLGRDVANVVLRRLRNTQAAHG